MKDAVRTDAVPAKPAAGQTGREAAGTILAPEQGAARPPGEVEQFRLFDQASREFHGRNYAAALALFERAAGGPGREVAHAARLHARMCSQRMARAELSLRTPDEHYDYAVSLINQRRLEQAEKHLLHAIAQSPRGDHLYYALALCRGLGGDLEGACLNLKHAIELEPRNRVTARNDPDFAEIGQMAPLRELLYPERAASA